MQVDWNGETYNANIDRVMVSTRPVVCVEAVFILTANGATFYYGISMSGLEAVSYLAEMSVLALYQELLNQISPGTTAAIDLEDELNG
jgi:hypothetical protein